MLYAKSLGASATEIGILAGLPALMNLGQIPAAHWLPRLGYRGFMLAGWSARTAVVFLIALLPMLGFFSSPTKLALLVGLIFLFSLLRGIAAGAMLPWISELIPHQARGRFLARDQIFLQAGSLAALTLSGLMLGKVATPGRFALAFLLGGVGGSVSLFYLLRVPDANAPEKLKRSSQSVPWFSIMSFPPFFGLLIYTCLWVLAVGGSGIFTATWLKSRGYQESTILLINCATFVAAMVSLPLAGRVIDRSGSRNVLALSMLLYAVAIAGWFALAAHLTQPSLPLIGALCFLVGLAGANFNLANTRLLMATMPEMGRSHFFAFFTVLTSLALAATPVIWGAVIDRLRGHTWGHFPEWNSYSICFALWALLGLVGVACTYALKEATHPSTDGKPLPTPLSEGN